MDSRVRGNDDGTERGRFAPRAHIQTVDVRPFADLVVVELASVLAGPSVGLFFAELGAAVVKVENVRTGGDATRRWLLPSETPGDDRPAYFCAVNWGKRSLALDLTTEGGRDALHALARRADVVVGSYRPGQAAALGADADTLRALNPGLIVVDVDGYGPADPRAGYDAVVQAESGFTALNGQADGPPTKMPVALVDVLAGHQLKEAALVALLHRAQTGEGAHLRVSLLGAGVASLANQASAWLAAGAVPERMGSAHPTIAPYGTAYPTRDGEVVLAVGTDRQFAALAEILGLDDLSDDVRFATNAERVRHRDALDARLGPALRARETAPLLAACEAAGVPAGAVRAMPDVFAHAEAARLVLGAGTGLGAVRTVAFTDGTHPAPLREPPRYAADTRAVLRDLAGLDDAAIDALVATGAAAERAD